MTKEQFVEQYIKPMLIETRLGVTDVEYVTNGLFEEQVVVHISGSKAIINVTWDSPWGMIKDIVCQLEAYLS